MSSILQSDMCLFLEGNKLNNEATDTSSFASERSLPENISNIYTPFVCLRGTRGIGKTHELIRLGQRISTHCKQGRVLYVSLNQFYFANHSLYSFALEAWANGVSVLLLDQIFKYPNWATELLRCYDDLPGLQIIFSTSSVMTLEEDYPELKGLVTVLDLYGFSFRQYLNHHYDLNIPTYTLEELTERKEHIYSRIFSKVPIKEAFDNYLRCGYYPPSDGELSLFGERLVKNMNMLLEVDLVYIRQIAPTYLPKLRQLLYLIGQQKGGGTNVSALSNDVGVSRATIMNYLKYLSDARLIRLLYKEGGAYPKKPDKVFLNDSNILAHIEEEDNRDLLLHSRTFLISACQDAGLTINLSDERGIDFIVDQKYKVRCQPGEEKRRLKLMSTINATCEVTSTSNRDFPIWLFGLLY